MILIFFSGQGNPVDFSRMDLGELSPDMTMENFEHTEFDQYLPTNSHPASMGAHTGGASMKGLPHPPPYAPNTSPSSSTWMNHPTGGSNGYHRTPPSVPSHRTSPSSSISPDLQGTSPTGGATSNVVTDYSMNTSTMNSQASPSSGSGIKQELSSPYTKSGYEAQPSGYHYSPYPSESCDEGVYSGGYQGELSQYYGGSMGYHQTGSASSYPSSYIQLCQMAASGSTPLPVNGPNVPGQWSDRCYRP